MMRTVIVSLILLFSSTDFAISKTKSEDDALRSLCNIGRNADGKIWGNSKINKAIQILKNGGVIAIFPAGGVAWARKKGFPVEEDDWKPMLGRLINDSKCDVLITKFGGQNSKAFQFASRIHQTFKQSLYLYEIRKSLDKPIKFEVLKYFKNETLPKIDDKGLSLFLQSKVKASH